jgi:CheY-like chemotaxis protein
MTRIQIVPHILVVDDEPDVESMSRQHFRRDLRLGRFITEFALSASAALERVKAIADPSSILILSDINKPGMSGLEMRREVRAERQDAYALAHAIVDTVREPLVVLDDELTASSPQAAPSI